MRVETIQDWIQGFESHISQRFNKDISIIALEGGLIMDVESVCKIVCHVSGISMVDLRSHNRKIEVVAARHVSMTLAYKHLTSSLKTIGEYFGYNDHTTVIHARRSVQDKLDIGDEMVTHLYKESDTLIKKVINEKITQ